MIKIQNIYHMLAYAFRVLRERGYKEVATEKFANAADLCAAILVRGVSMQLKRGLARTYLPHSEPLSAPRGKIDIASSLKTRESLRHQLICSFDDFSENSPMNQIIKATFCVLLRADIREASREALRRLLFYFSEVDAADLRSVRWNLRFNRNNQSYRMLIAICYLVAKGLLQTQADGTMKLMDFFDEQSMHRLYEKFLLEFFRREYPELTVRAARIPWASDDGSTALLPVMQSDIMLSQGSTVLIIDAKYYEHALQTQYDVSSLRSAHLYQIFTYVKNKDAEYGEKPHTVAGMLLYAKTDETVQPSHTYRLSGNKISVNHLELNQDFDKITRHLDAIVREHFGNGNVLIPVPNKLNA